MIKKLTLLNFLTQTSHASNKIKYNPQDNRTFAPLLNKHPIFGYGITVNFAKLTTISTVFTVAVM